jgi:hypothetical protein
MRMALVSAAQDAPATADQLGLSLAERERSQSGWWYLIVAVFLLLVAETMFSNRGAEGRNALLERWRAARG